MTRYFVINRGREIVFYKGTIGFSMIPDGGTRRFYSDGKVEDEFDIKVLGYVKKKDLREVPKSEFVLTDVVGSLE